MHNILLEFAVPKKLIKLIEMCLTKKRILMGICLMGSTQPRDYNWRATCKKN
jgi:hypothetical protein